MKRRTVLLGGVGVAAAAAGGALLWRPGDRGGPYSEYFSRLNSMLRADGHGRPVMLLDIDRINHNVDVIANSVGKGKTYRVVVKSLPSTELLGHVMRRAGTNALMVFHQPFLNEVAEKFPESDALLGKPMPVSA
ncbi:MAG: DSD1 family PLP-dependent enzyme, partial [Pseudomonadales bacterium]|nr:DSD1 family PLP-dependent enzyme [Pseudomonadales bacterium]